MVQDILDNSAVERPLLDDEEAQPEPYVTITYWDIVSNFVPMGWTAFGGPQAHIGMFETVRHLLPRRAVAITGMLGV